MAYQDNENRRQMFDDSNIADSRDQEVVLKGIQPKNQVAFKLFKIFRTLGVLAAVFGAIMFGLTFVPNFKMVTGAQLYKVGILIFVGLALLLFFLMLCMKLIFLRKAPFDDWVFEVAQRALGTDLIFYTSKCLYIKYDIASAKEVDKRDFVTQMSDLSIHYSYFYVDTFVDQQVIQVECTKKQPIPKSAVLEPEDDIFPGIIPLGLTINNTSQKVSPISWTLNPNNSNPNILETMPSVSLLIAGGTGSGKSVCEQNIVNHVSHFSEDFQLVGVDCKRVEFNQLRGVKGVKGVALDVKTAANTVAIFQQQMMKRFKFMEENQTNNVYKLKDVEVDYFEIFGKKYQFDEMFELMVDLDPDDRDYSKLLMTYPEGRMPKIISIEEIYNGIEKGEWSNPSMPQVKGYNPYIKRGDIKKTRGIFKPKILLLLIDEMNELMTADDYKSVDTIKGALGSIARLGRAAGVHLALAMQRASGGTVSSDLMNNIQQAILLGAFDSGSSTLMFEKDITNLAKPEIKGRGFMQVGKKDIYEVQTYWIEPENVWVFDEEQRLTYDNAVYLEQCRRKGIEPDMNGFVAPKKVDELEEATEEISDYELDESNNNVNELESINWDEFTGFDDEEDEEVEGISAVDPSFKLPPTTQSIQPPSESIIEDNKPKRFKLNSSKL